MMLTPIINREVRKMKEDPEIKTAEEAVQIAMDQ